MFVDQPIWLPDGRLIIVSNGVREKIQYVEVENGSLHTLVASGDAQCREGTNYLFPTLLPDGRLGFVKECFGFVSATQPIQNEVRFLVAYNWDTGEVGQVVGTPLPSRNASYFTWNPTMSRGLQVTTNGLEGILYWVNANGAEPFTATVANMQNSYTLDIDLKHVDDLFGAYASTNTALFGKASWSPNGDQLAFWVSLEALGQSGRARSNGEWELFLMDLVSQQPQLALSGVYHPLALAWSPDGRWLAFFGETLNKDHSLWLFSPSNETLALVTEVDHSQTELAWSPGGDEIATVGIDSDGKSELWVYDVSQITQSSDGK